MKCTVLYDCWQMECCGNPFSVGDTVRWLVQKAEDALNMVIDIGKIDYCYEAHSGDWQKIFVIEGSVQKIGILYESFAQSADNPQLLIPVSGEIVEAEGTKRFENKHDGMDSMAYIVSLDDAAVRSAEKEEVRFV